MRTSSILAIFMFAACGGGGGGGGTAVDAPATGKSIKISGAAKDGVSMAAVAGVMITANKSSDDSVVAMTTSAADGTYSLTVPFDGTSLDGYVKATLTDYADTYLFPPAPLTADFAAAAVNMIKANVIPLLYQSAGVTQDTTAGTISLEVVDTTGATLAGAMITTSPAGTYRYGIPPSGTAVMTDGGGVASDLNAPVGSVTVMAAKAGLTFKSHVVKVFANALTTTLVSE